jgi:hypothetical protein
MRLGQFLTPNLAAEALNGFMDLWAKRAEPRVDTDGSLFDPPSWPQGLDGMNRDPDRRRTVKAGALAAGAAAAVSAAWIWHRRRSNRGKVE